MSIGTLWTTKFHGSGKTIRAVAALGGLQLDVPEDYVHFQDNNKPEFRAKFPHGKIPAFEGQDGFYLSETYAIARYVAALAPNSGLLSGDPKKDALIDQWSSFALTEIQPYISYVFMLVKGLVTPYNKPIHQDLNNRALRAYKSLNEHLANNTFLVGERITVADLVVAGVLARAVTISLDAELRKELPHVIRHLETIVNQPAIKDIFGPLEYVEKALAYVPPPKEKKEPAPKQEKVVPKPKAVEEDEEDEKPFEEPKPKNPLDLLPKSTFNLEDWKRAYSNMDTRGAGGSLEYFYKNYDPEGFSVWGAKYKYPSELTQTFMSSNLIGGFFNRLEASRKYLFGSMGVLGSDNNSQIDGVFILRGQEADPVFDVAPDKDSYEFRKLDLNNEADKEYFEAALAWDLTDKETGRTWLESAAKNFK